MLLKALEYLKKENYLKGEFRAIVVDNNDPDKLKRIKVKIPKIFESDDNEKLPWCYPNCATALGGRPDLSSFEVPEIYSLVTIEFPFDDNVYFPVYKGYYANESTVQTALLEEDYPEIYGSVDSTVSFIRINKKQKYAEVYHVSETLFRVDEDGNITLTLPKSFTIEAKEDFNFKVGKNFNINTVENFNLGVEGKTSIDSFGNIEIQTLENFNLLATMKLNLTATTEFNFMAQKVSCTCATTYAEQVGGAHTLTCGGAHGVAAGGAIAHKANLITHNVAPPPPLPATPPDPADLTELDAGIADLETAITDLQSRLDELKTLAEETKSKGEEIKTKLETEANELVGDTE